MVRRLSFTRHALLVWWVAILLTASRAASPETWEAPIGGKAGLLGDGRVGCPGTASRMPLTHPEVVTGADCEAVSCALSAAPIGNVGTDL